MVNFGLHIVIFRAAVVFCFVISIGSAFAEYQRKQLKPDFFIPEAALPQPEKLPPIKIPEPAEEEESVVQVSQRPVSSSNINPVQSAEKSRNESAVPLSAHPEAPSFKLSNMPEYKHKYDDYITDLKYIAETGKYPQNQALQNDLSKMSSDEILYLD